MLGKLIVKELKGYVLIPAGIIGTMILAWNLFLYFHIGSWQDNEILGLGVLPAVILLIWAVVMAFYTLYSEWNTNTVYLLLSLPVKGFTILGSKIIANLSCFLFVNVFGLASYLLCFHKIIWGPISFIMTPELWTGVGQFFGWLQINSLLLTALVVVLGQFAFLAGRISPKFRGLITTITFLFSFWLCSKIYQLFHAVLYWIPSVELQIHPIHTMKSVKWDFEFMLIIVLITVGFLSLNSLLFERKIEI